MLSLVRWWAVAVGLAAGMLAVAIANLVVGLILAASDVADPTMAALPLSLLIGFAAGGGVASRFAPVAGRFHGAIASLGMAGIVIIVAGRAGSPLPIVRVLLLLFLALVIGGLAGWMVDRRH